MAREEQQAGFDFWAGEDFTPIEKPAGTWENRVELSAGQWLAKFEQAETTLLSLAGPGRVAFRMALEQIRARFDEQIQRMEYASEDVFGLWVCRPELDDETMDRFIEHCETHAGAKYDRTIYKVAGKTNHVRLKAYGMHVEGLGSLVARDWGNSNRGIDFELIDQDTFFLDSYEDGSPEYEAPYTLWGRAMSCQKLAESGDAVCNVTTVQHLGRDFMVTGIEHGKEYRKGWGWSLVPACDWRGKTYSYRGQIDAYNSGVLQRGDHRGLLVKVRGELCVVDGFAMFIAKGADAEGVVTLDEEDDEPEVGDVFEDLEAEELEAE